MRTPTISDEPMLVGRLVARHAARAARLRRWQERRQWLAGALGTAVGWVRASFRI